MTNGLAILVALGFREEEGGTLVLPPSVDLRCLEARKLELAVCHMSHTLSIFLNTLSQCTLSIHPPHTLSQYTLLIHPVNIPLRSATHPLNTPFEYIPLIYHKHMLIVVGLEVSSVSFSTTHPPNTIYPPSIIHYPHLL